MLPNEVGSKDYDSNRGGKPRVDGFEFFAPGAEERGEPDSGDEPESAEFVQHGESADEAKPEPKFSFLRVGGVEVEEGGSGPKGDIDAIHRIEMADDGVGGRESGEEAGEDLGVAVCSELSGDETIQDDGGGSGKDPWDADGPDIGAEDCGEQFEDSDGEGRMINITPIKPVGAGEVIELVAEIPVPVNADEVDEEG